MVHKSDHSWDQNVGLLHPHMVRVTPHLGSSPVPHARHRPTQRPASRCECHQLLPLDKTQNEAPHHLLPAGVGRRSRPLGLGLAQEVRIPQNVPLPHHLHEALPEQSLSGCPTQKVPRAPPRPTHSCNGGPGKGQLPSKKPGESVCGRSRKRLCLILSAPVAPSSG